MTNGSGSHSLVVENTKEFAKVVVLAEGME